MKFSSASRNVAEAVKSILRNRMMSLSSVIIAAACLLIMILMYCVTANVTSMLEQIESDVRIAIFIDDEVSADGVNNILDTVRANELVTSVEYLDRDANLRTMLDSGLLDPDLFETLMGSNRLRRRMDISLENMDAVRTVAEWLMAPEMERVGVAKVTHASDEVDNLTAVNRAIRTACLCTIGVLALLSVVIIANTVRLTIDNRKNEIGIMKFIGSTNWFIRWPFLLEGMILGTAGAVIAIIIAMVFYDRLRGIVSVFNTGSMSLLTGADLFPLMVPAAILIGAGIGALSSLSTIRKYLDV